MPESINKRLVFVIHGRNYKAKDAVCEFLTSLDLTVIDWEQAVRATGSASPDTYEVVKIGLEMAQAIVVILTPDDIAQLDPQLQHTNENPAELTPTGQARQNVILEAGMALAMKREQTILLRLGTIREISDVKGINYVAISNSQSLRENFRKRLITTGCAVDDTLDYLNAGDFENAVKPLKTAASLVSKINNLEIPEGINTLERVFDSLESDWDSVKPIDSQDHADVSKGKFIIKRLKSAFSGHASDIKKLNSEELEKNFKTIIRNLNNLEDWQLYMDGGETYRKFWEYGNQFFKDSRDLINEIRGM